MRAGCLGEDQAQIQQGVIAMSILSDIYVAARTRDIRNANTADPPVLVVRRGSEILFSQQLAGGHDRFARGGGAVWRFPVRDANLDHADLVLLLRASSDDAWAFEHVIIWGTTQVAGEEVVIPLASSLDYRRGRAISTDGNEGWPERQIGSVGRGLDTTRAERIIVIAATSPYGDLFPPATERPFPIQEWLDNTGTTASVTLQAGAADRLLLSYTLPTVYGGTLETGRGAFLVTDLAVPFGRRDVKDGRFTLSIDGLNSWVPAYFAVFGVGPEDGTPRVLIPFVAATGDQLKVLATGERGFHSLVLPKARVLHTVGSSDVVDPDDLDGVLARRVSADKLTAPVAAANGGAAAG
jgi:hypothetical protein